MQKCMKEYQQRQEAIQRHIKGEKVALIARSMGKSRKWVHHWIRRFKGKPGGGEWFKNESKAPKNTNRRLSPETEHQILLIRNELVHEKMAQTGAISIQYEFEKRGLKPAPAIWTINRVIASHGLNKQVPAHKTPREYPELFAHTHQMDLVGPRYIKGDGRFYSINLIDITSHYCFIKAARTKSSENILNTVVLFWQTYGMPDALQMDNELAFRGSNRYPRSFGSVVRFALSQGVSPVFIPLKEPWRNGIIEKFNDTYRKKFLSAYTFKNFEDACGRQEVFMNFHNTNHRYSTHGSRTPCQVQSRMLQPAYYKGDTHTLKTIPLTQGSVYFIRFIRSNLKLQLLNETFILLPEMMYSYVVAEINIENHCLIIRQNGEIRQIFTYQMPVDW